MTSRYHDDLSLRCLRDEAWSRWLPLQGNQVLRLERGQRLVRARGRPHHHEQLIAERGPLETGSLFYHMNAVQSWGIAADGSVKNVHPLG